MNTKRVLILSESYGLGHTKVAEAIKQGINMLRPDWKTNMLELGEWLRPNLSHLITEIYLKTIRYSPKLWAALYYRNKDRAVRPRFEFLLHRTIYTEVVHLINKHKPDIIVATHPFPSAVISRLKRMGLDVNLHTVLTDFSAHGTWVSSGVDFYYVPTEEAKNQLKYMGVEESQVFVTGIPTQPRFWVKNDKELIRKKMGFCNKPTILYMGGGLGIGIVTELIDELYQYRDSIQSIIVTGNNKTLYRNLTEKNKYQHPHFHIYGYVNNIDELMDASDILITKPGGVTSAEAIAKGLPMMLLNPIPGQEEGNIFYITRNKFGNILADTNEQFIFLNKFSLNPAAFLSNFNLISQGNEGKKAIEQIIKNSSSL